MSLFSHLAPAKRHSRDRDKETTTNRKGRTSHNRKHRRTSSTGMHK